MTVGTDYILKEDCYYGKVCAVGFILLFPGFFFYHTLIGLGIMPAILAGYLRPVSFLFLLCIFLFGFRFIFLVLPKPGYPGFLYFTILFWSMIVALWHYLFGSVAGNLEVLEWSISGILLGFTCYVIGKGLPLDKRVFVFIVLLCLMAMVLIVLQFKHENMFYIRSLGIGDEEKTTSYQGFARSLAMTGILALAFINNWWFRFFLASLTIVSLYFNGARTELVCFALSFFIVLFFFILRKGRSVLYLLVLLLFLFTLPLFSFQAVQERLPENRVLQLLDLAGSSSAIKRSFLNESGLETINDFPFFGSYAFYYKSYGVGGYPHNLLSAWVNLGLVGVTLYVALLFFLFFIFFTYMWKSYFMFNSVLGFLALQTLFFVVTALLFAKDYSYMLLGFAVAFLDRVWLISKTKGLSGIYTSL